MRALFIADVPLDAPTSGSEQVLFYQATGLAGRGVEVHAITRHADHLPWLVRHVRGVQEGSYSASETFLLRALISFFHYPLEFYRSFCGGVPFQVAVSHQPFNCFLLLITRKLTRTPILYVFHSPSHEEYLLSHQKGNYLKNLIHVKGRRMLEKLCIKKASRIMVLSRYMKHKVQDIHGIPSERVVINPGGVDVRRFAPAGDRGALKTQLGFPEGKVHLLTVRNLEPRMGIENLLTCIHILKKSEVDLHLIIGGEGAERRTLEEMITGLGLREEATMKGFIPPELLPLYYGAADFFILPTKQLEGFGLVTPESMACGTPVLGTPVGGTQEILSGFEPRFLFRDTTAEAMAEGIRESLRLYFPFGKDYDHLRARCREYAVANYSWERHISQLQSIVNEIL
jgi:glycosyltransferase involved in cell wall biosynthesis